MALLIVGCGYLGLRVARRACADGRTVYALTRSRADHLRSLGIIPVVGDVTDPASLNLPAVESVVHAVGLDRRSGKTMREVYVEGLAHLLDHLQVPRRFTFVSSTSVYGQTDGSWVDESSPTEPIEESGRVVREAEGLVRSRLPFATILRFAGIYGPGRILRKAALLAGDALLGDAGKWLNLIHVDDGATAVRLAEKVTGETINIADDEPVTRRDFYTCSAELLNAPPAAFAAGPSTRGDTNRRIRNAKARRVLQFQPIYPSYRQGMIHAVAHS
jgi:nucleoside-diphosphate-sugar epimerase